MATAWRRLPPLHQSDHRPDPSCLPTKLVEGYNLNAQLGEWVAEQAAKIMAAAQTNFDDIFRDVFAKAGYEVVTTTGPDVLRVNSSILDLTVNAPRGETVRNSWFSLPAKQRDRGVRDTVTNALLGRVADYARRRNLVLANCDRLNQPLRFPATVQPLG